MITMKNIVVATDLSEPATAALNYGREFARKWGGNLHLVHVIAVPAPASFIRCTSNGGPFVVVARDGETLATEARFKADSLNAGPGQRYDVIWTALKPGKWMIHCHISHHATNNNTERDGGGGLMMHIEVEGDPTK